MAHHYFATNALGWATAPTLEEAIEKLWHSYTSGDTRKWLANSHKEGNFGITFWTCRVPLDSKEEYRIEYYAPKVEGLTESKHWFLTYYSKGKIAYRLDPEDTIRRLRQEIKNLEATKQANCEDCGQLDWLLPNDNGKHLCQGCLAFQDIETEIS